MEGWTRLHGEGEASEEEKGEEWKLSLHQQLFLWLHGQWPMWKMTGPKGHGSLKATAGVKGSSKAKPEDDFLGRTALGQCWVHYHFTNSIYILIFMVLLIRSESWILLLSLGK